jgi:tRNA dimethylallyltransferase
MRILVLVGPTASGKTEVACEISRHLPVEMISCDSMQVYRSMPIVTQAPSLRVSRRLRAHLVSFLEPSLEYSAARFRKDVMTLVPQIVKRKRVPLLVGGTGLYLRAWMDGLFETDREKPAKDEALRKKLLLEQEKHGGDHLYERLKAVDPKAAEKIHPHDFRRLIRALEVYLLTRKPISELQRGRQGIRGTWPHRIFLLERTRPDLYARIHARVDTMIAGGLVEEVRELSKKKLSLTAGVALGIREIQNYLSGNLTLEEAKELLKKNTRHYAKRQLSWFRHEKGVETVSVEPGESPSKTADKILKLWRAF